VVICRECLVITSAYIFPAVISFAELKANPTKAKKAHNMPKNANEFARKYYDGFYTLAEDADTAADSKSSHK
jgi:hypothetical protein